MQPQTATLIPEYIDQPMSAKGPGSVRAKDGPRYKVWPDKLALFEKGRTYQVTYKTEQYNGKDQYTILTAEPIASGTGPAVAANGHAAPPDREKAILTAVLAKLVGPIPLGTREQMANEMTLIYLAAQDACERIVS